MNATLSQGRRSFRFPGTAIAAILIATSVAAATDSRQQESKAPEPAASKAAGQAPAQQLREGATLVDLTGYFKASGDRFAFYKDGSERSFNCLENLSLERIGKAISESPEDLRWTISATVTEYQGTNYLLITRATMNNRRSAEGRVKSRKASL